MPEAEAKAQAAIDSARVRGKRRVSGHFEKVRAGEAGRRIVLEAKEIEAAAVVMALPPRRVRIIDLREDARNSALRAARAG